MPTAIGASPPISTALLTARAQPCEAAPRGPSPPRAIARRYSMACPSQSTSLATPGKSPDVAQGRRRLHRCIRIESRNSGKCHPTDTRLSTQARPVEIRMLGIVALVSWGPWEASPAGDSSSQPLEVHGDEAPSWVSWTDTKTTTTRAVLGMDMTLPAGPLSRKPCSGICP